MAEKRFWVSRSSSTPKAPEPRPLESVLERLRRVHHGPVHAHLRDGRVAEVRHELQEAEDPERAAEPDAVGQHAAQERAADGRRLADRGARDADVEVAEARSGPGTGR